MSLSVKNLEKLFVSNKYVKELKSIEEEINNLEKELPNKLENMSGEKQIKIMKSLFGKKGIMNRLAATDNSSSSKFNKIAEKLNEHSDNPLNIHKNNIFPSMDYLSKKFKAGEYNKNVTQDSKLRNSAIEKSRKELEQLSNTFAKENDFSVKNVELLRNTPYLIILTFYLREDDHEKKGVYLIDKNPQNQTRNFGDGIRRNGRPQFIANEKIDEYTCKVEKILNELKEEYDKKVNNYTKSEIKNLLRAISDYTAFIKEVNQLFASYCKNQSFKSKQTLGGKQKGRFAKICMNLKYNPPTEQEIKKEIIKLKQKQALRKQEIFALDLEQIKLDL